MSNRMKYWNERVDRGRGATSKNNITIDTNNN